MLDPTSMPHRPQSSPTSSGDQPLINGQSGTRSLVENLYGVEVRDSRPRKRAKIETTEQQDQVKGTKGHSSYKPGTGIVGEYMRPDPDKAAEITKNSLVDLTNDNDASDDDVQIVGSKSRADEEVCYGHIASLIQAFIVPKPKGTSAFASAQEWPAMTVKLSRIPAKDTVIDAHDASGMKFGKVNSDLAAALAPAMDGLRNFRTQARLINRRKKPNEWPHQPCSDQLRVIVNLYGRRADVDKVGKHFGQANFWFRPPMAADNSAPFVNPHTRKHIIVPPTARGMGQSRSVGEARTLEEATEAVSKVFDSFASASRNLGETNPPAAVIRTPLLSHQKQALTFMLRQEQPRTFGTEEHENSSLWRRKQRKNGDVQYNEVVTGLSCKDEPDQVLGGLLADVMGLGKTLEALSLVGSTLPDAATFGESKPVLRGAETEQFIQFNAKSTLIVCPTSTVKNWEDQVSAHMAFGTISYTVFHGPNREKNPDILRSYDIVITTYGIIASEFSSKSTDISPIRQLKWFRIVLDEAHTIREQKAQQTKACYALEAQRRWCLTGTPIQNRLDDLGSLTRFLRLYPYDSTARFVQYVRSPAQAGDPAFLKTLRVFVDSFTLRRNRDRIDLPPRQDLVAKLEFTDDERALHDFFKDRARGRIQDYVQSKEKNSGVQHHVLRGIMTLRLICAHGRELLKGKDLNELRGESAVNAIDIETHNLAATITKKAALESLTLRAEAELDNCVNCNRSISKDIAKNELDDEDNAYKCFILPCLDLICSECFSAIKPDMDSKPNTDAMDCHFCHLQIAAQYVGFSGPTAQEIIVAPDDTIASDDNSKENTPIYHGPHTKTRALLEDIAELYRDSEPLEAAGERPLKCVIFSEFTSHLNLIERALIDNGYGTSFVRIDGTMSLPKRRKAMDALDHDPTIRILLASIKAAGQGLNLVAASRAFIMEPMWNPAAEAQAVDRVYRIGQKRPVIVKRYQMKDSIEGKIVELQRRKQQLADVATERNYEKLSKSEVREQHMKEILALFK
jgi:SNF2 family DNA or RNA helicase